jgi:hypothetical protein
MSMAKQDLILAEKFATAELTHLMSFYDAVISPNHLIRVVELENDCRAIVKKLAQLESKD